MTEKHSPAVWVNYVRDDDTRTRAIGERHEDGTWMLNPIDPDTGQFAGMLYNVAADRVE